MKHTALIKTDDLANMHLPPGCDLRLEDGREVQPSEVAFYISVGQTVEIYQDGQNVGRIRPPADQLSPENVDMLGDMIETGKRENFKGAVNWID